MPHASWEMVFIYPSLQMIIQIKLVVPSISSALFQIVSTSEFSHAPESHSTTRRAKSFLDFQEYFAKVYQALRILQPSPLLGTAFLCGPQTCLFLCSNTTLTCCKLGQHNRSLDHTLQWDSRGHCQGEREAGGTPGFVDLTCMVPTLDKQSQSQWWW